jgi:hypothetical protein
VELPEVEELQVKEVFTYFGLASYQAQCVERQLAVLLATAFGPGIRNVTSSEYDELLEGLFKKTLGTLIRTLQESAELSKDFEQILHRALKKRNWLMHHFFWDRAGHFALKKGRQHMIEELQEIADELGLLDTMLIAIGRAWSASIGLTDEKIDAELRAVISEANEMLEVATANE